MKLTRSALGASAVIGCLTLVARGLVVIDVHVGRRRRALGPIERDLAAPPEQVFDVISAPYLGRTPRAMRHKLGSWSVARTWCWRRIARRHDLVQRQPSR